ncbi:hypothetical protein, partial [Thiolapillus sp.]|uniref:hypothetical protein n=1 Tax=Thiolapillus sp. TaxID=2017437 RepID=UPI0025FE0F45
MVSFIRNRIIKSGYEQFFISPLNRAERPTLSRVFDLLTRKSPGRSKKLSTLLSSTGAGLIWVVSKPKSLNAPSPRIHFPFGSSGQT